jgi:CheY-like chemotaxis protein
LLTSELTPEQRDQAETVKQSADALLGILDDILDLSKIEAGKLALETVEFNIHQTVKGVVELMTSRAQGKGLKLYSCVGSNIPASLRGDPHRLRQLLLNLVSNAIKFTERGEIAMELSCRAETHGTVELHCAVRDTGIGLSEEAQQKLFRPFTQADSSTTRKFGGTGLGLAICRQLVELMAGEIGVTSTEGKGATFWFNVPLEKSPSTDHARLPNKSRAPVTMGLPGRQTLRVLLAEDNRTNQKIAAAQLGKLGCEVEIVSNGREAVRAWERASFDVIFMDCQMPEMDGLEATRKIRALEKERSARTTTIVAMTASAMQGDRESCLRAGMDDYISKPVDMTRLQAVLARNLSGVCGQSETGTVTPPKHDK